jgi:hypothetical protein
LLPVLTNISSGFRVRCISAVQMVCECYAVRDGDYLCSLCQIVTHHHPLSSDFSTRLAGTNVHNRSGIFIRRILSVEVTQLNPPCPESTSELYRPSDRRLSSKLVPTFADRRCHVVSVTDSYRRILAFLDQSRYFLFQVTPQLYPRG